MKIIERFVRSKRGDDGGEDGIVATADFAAVIDGATSHVAYRWKGRTSGQLATVTLSEAIKSIPANSTAADAVETMTQALAAVYEQYGRSSELTSNPVERASASVVMYSRDRREVWSVGDCQYGLLASGRLVQVAIVEKRVDEVIAAARSLFLQAELRRGVGLEELRQHDSGREYIDPLLQRQHLWQNSTPIAEYVYWVIDGFPVAAEGVQTIAVPPNVTHVILASDGYPRILPTLNETEAFLRGVIAQDPLLIGEYKTTKGVSLGAESFDDRAYLCLEV